ncbi:WGxxGxxG family protein [Amycolatopsis sp. PS_44_ISF1]|uniref:WGxxGxxG family protein n=1 Tax=Amycolatopsis sp. PS_44_ISF1 TaxID=2974917 RepID=UPI0028DF2EDF|nr:WGxxGxxG family protein [Amycolatopsis sp. PS_44_ISF1]MDT8912991.1 WGxxGxxG-CTERM domain-containing protein [Amycolatopsis sp. PS_44_ISF1]
MGALFAAAVIPLAAAGSAQAAPSPVIPVAQDQGDGTNGGNSRDGNGDNGLWGLLGLLGLVGLAGLVRRGPKPGAMAGYPADAPPVATYPPAEPHRRPPGA